MASAILKLIFGLVLLGIGLYLISPGRWWDQFVTVFKGTLPLFLIVFGLLVVWVESEELKPKPPPPKITRKK